MAKRPTRPVAGPVVVHTFNGHRVAAAIATVAPAQIMSALDAASA